SFISSLLLALVYCFFFLFTEPAPPELYTLSLHDALPISGLAQVDRALDSQVIATVDGEGAAALREIDGSATFTATLISSAQEDLEFTLPEVALLAETNEAGETTTVRPSAGTVTAPEAVTVPAGGTASVEVTVSPEAGEDHFTGGWVRFA